MRLPAVGRDHSGGSIENTAWLDGQVCVHASFRPSRRITSRCCSAVPRNIPAAVSGVKLCTCAVYVSLRRFTLRLCRDTKRRAQPTDSRNTRPDIFAPRDNYLEFTGRAALSLNDNRHRDARPQLTGLHPGINAILGLMPALKALSPYLKNRPFAFCDWAQGKYFPSPNDGQKNSQPLTWCPHGYVLVWRSQAPTAIQATSGVVFWAVLKQHFSPPREKQFTFLGKI